MFWLLAVSAAPVDLSAEIKREVARQECGAEPSNDEVVVCSKRRERNRYRLIEIPGPRDVERERPNAVRERAKWIEEGDTGINSCSPVGPGGGTGCMQKGWKKKRQQRDGWYGL